MMIKELLIKELRVALSNILLYPADSEIIKQSLENCIKEIVDFLKTSHSLTISESEGNLVINDEPVDTPGGIFLDCLTTSKIKSITFRSGFSQTELYNFLHELSAKHKPTPTAHITIDEKLYVAMGDKDLVIARGQELLGIKEKIMLHVDEIADLLNTVDESDLEIGIKNDIIARLGLGEPITEPSQTKKTTKEYKEMKEFNVQEILKRSDEYMLDDKLLQKLPSLLDSLKSPEELELAGELCNKLASNLEARVTDVRLKAIIAFKRLYSVIESLREPKIIKDIDKQFVEAGRKETNGEVYKEIVDILGRAATRYLKQGDYASTRMITEMLGDHAKSTEFNERRETAKSTIDNLVGTEFTRLLVYDLCSNEESRREKAVSILLDTGEACVQPLIAELKEAPDIRLRKAIADVITKIGEAGIIQLMNEIKSEPSPIATSKMLDVLDGIGYEEQVVEGLRKLLHHPNFYVRRKVVDILYKIGTTAAKQSLFEAIDDEVSAIKERVIASLGELHYKPAAPKLIEMLDKNKKEKELIQVSICKALSEFGDTKAVPVLLKVASSGGVFHPARPREVRMAAIEALVILGDKRVSQFAKDKDRYVQKFVKQLIGEQKNIDNEE